MTIKRFIFSLSTILIFTLNSFSQTDFRPGYYITWENDTVYGLVDYRGEIRNSKFCVYKKHESENTIKLMPAEIQAYRFIDSKYYISKDVELKDSVQQIFLEFLLNGMTNLYYYKDNQSHKYFLEDQQGNLLELENDSETIYIEGKGYFSREKHTHIGLLKATFADCNEIQSKLNNIELTHKSLIEVTKEYHDYVCNDEVCIIYEKKLPLVKVSLAPLVGGGFISLDFQSGFHSNFSFDPVNSPSIGILINTSLPRINEKLSFQIETQLCKTDFYSFYQDQPNRIIKNYDAFINTFSSLSSVALKYTYPKGKIRPSLALGGVFNYLFDTTTKVRTETVYEDIIHTSETDNIPLPNSLWGGIVQLGCDFKAFNKHKMFVHLKLYKCTGKDSDITTVMNSANFSIGMFLSKN